MGLRTPSQSQTLRMWDCLLQQHRLAHPDQPRPLVELDKSSRKPHIPAKTQALSFKYPELLFVFLESLMSLLISLGIQEHPGGPGLDEGSPKLLELPCGRGE